MTLYAHLKHSDLILTPNERLCAYIKSQMDHFLASEGNLVWEPLPIFALNRWLNQNNALNVHQERLLWQKANPSFSHLIPLAQKAWDLCHQQAIDIKDAVFLKNSDTQFFQQWTLKTGLIKRYDFNHIQLPPKTVLIGFPELSESEEKLFRQAEKFQLKKTPASVLRLNFKDTHEELKNMAMWAAQQPPDKSIGCVIPNLHEMRDRVEYYFHHYFGNTLAYNISLGQSLSHYALIQDALNALRLFQEYSPLENISQFLLSPFFKSNPDLELKLRSRHSRIISKTLLPLKFLDLPQTQKPSEWALFFEQQLIHWGFPGNRPLNSQEYQLMEQFQEALYLYSQFDSLVPEWTYFTALQELTVLFNNIIFQPKSSPAAHVHILGVLESAGLNFDAVWIMGLHNLAWPAKPHINPFIPLEHASAEKELSFSKAITQQWLKSAETVIFSSPQSDDDRELQPSILIKEITAQKDFIINPLLTPAEKLFYQKENCLSVEIINDNLAPPLIIENLRHHSSGILKDQRACPFRAFAHHRLHAKKTHLPQLGFKAVERGNCIHHIMENLWKIIHTHENLISYSHADLHDLIVFNIDIALKKYTFISPKIFLDTERIRLEKLILNWLNHEKNREPFTVIATEEKIETHLGKLPLKLRLDRIDQLNINNNHYLIIDYKTGKSVSHTDPLDEPQLPLYAVLSALSVHSIAYAYINSAKIQLKPREITDLKSLWEKELTQLADDFCAGNAAILPKYGSKTCLSCDLKSLCRVNAIPLNAG